MVDAGTGSGILAIAARTLGAARALGIDTDPDAIAAARENLALNPSVTKIDFEPLDLSRTPLPDADVVTANLTGTLLVRSAARLMAAVRPAGHLVLSGILADEVDIVLRAFASLTLVERTCEDEWIAFILKKR